MAEETGLIIAIDQWVLREACRQLREWQVQFPAYRNLTINVNLSSKDFSQSLLIEHIERVLQDTGLQARHIKLEIKAWKRPGSWRNSGYYAASTDRAIFSPNPWMPRRRRHCLPRSCTSP